MTAKYFVESPNPWTPEPDKRTIARLGKLIEELTECSSAAARCIIQGPYECEPSTGKRNSEWLEDEIADVYNLLEFVNDHLKLDKARIATRIQKKRAHLEKWFAMLEEKE